jgi:hypothetical protein
MPERRGVACIARPATGCCAPGDPSHHAIDVPEANRYHSALQQKETNFNKRGLWAAHLVIWRLFNIEQAYSSRQEKEKGPVA